MDAETILSSDYRYVRPVISDNHVLDEDFEFDISGRPSQIETTDGFVYVSIRDQITIHNNKTHMVKHLNFDAQIISLESYKHNGKEGVLIVTTDNKLFRYDEISEQLKFIANLTHFTRDMLDTDLYVYIGQLDGKLTRYDKEKDLLDNSFMINLTGNIDCMDKADGKIDLVLNSGHLAIFNMKTETIEKTIKRDTTSQSVTIMSKKRYSYILEDSKRIVRYDKETDALKLMLTLDRFAVDGKISGDSIYLALDNQSVVLYSEKENIIKKPIWFTSPPRKMSDSGGYMYIAQDNKVTRFNGGFRNIIGVAIV